MKLELMMNLELLTMSLEVLMMNLAFLMMMVQYMCWILHKPCWSFERWKGRKLQRIWLNSFFEFFLDFFFELITLNWWELIDDLLDIRLDFYTKNLFGELYCSLLRTKVQGVHLQIKNHENIVKLSKSWEIITRHTINCQ